MQKKIQISVDPIASEDDAKLKSAFAAESGLLQQQITGFYLLRRSLDARSKLPKLLITANVFFDEPPVERPVFRQALSAVEHSKYSVVIAGAGPAGLFAALMLIRSGIRPVIIERGKDVRARRRDLAALNKEGIVNPESNYCFGEGGAGTYSDGKLYTRSTKRGETSRILDLLVQFGADDSILYEAHPHIGTNKLPAIISAIRKFITDCGGEFQFNRKLSGWRTEGGRIREISTADGGKMRADALLLATGHSARDIFQLMIDQGCLVEAKPFALGVRVEHPQELINQVRYHLQKERKPSDVGLPPAAYALVADAGRKSVFSFCMCPGGIIAPAATAPGEVVVNGWSPSKRNNPFANSGIVVNIEAADWQKFTDHGALAAMAYQSEVERTSFALGGGDSVAPAQRLTDFVRGAVSSTLPDCSYTPGVRSSMVADVFSTQVSTALRRAFPIFGEKMRGYFTDEAIVVAAESRTSSPVRIPRDPVSLSHPSLPNLFPCGEGAGYAGGIMSAAMDGERVAAKIAELLTSNKE